MATSSFSDYNIATQVQWKVACKLTPSIFASKVLGFEPYEWQQKALDSRSHQMIFNCSRQSGKSITAAIIALHRALFYPKSIVLLIGPSLREPSELFRKVKEFLDLIEPQPVLTENNLLSLKLNNKSRIISLPASGHTIRGFSADIIIEDEAAYVQDEINTIIRPMLAARNGKIILLSTPDRQDGHFYKTWVTGKEWERYLVTAEECDDIETLCTIDRENGIYVDVVANGCPHFTKGFLTTERREMTTRRYEQQYLCRFLLTEGALFEREWFKVIKNYPDDATFVRYWDLAASEKGDYTAGVLVGEKDGRYYIVDIKREQARPYQIQQTILTTAQKDERKHHTKIYIEQEGGASGPTVIDTYARLLKGFAFWPHKPKTNKEHRADPVSAAAEARNIDIVYGNWNDDFLDEIEAFPKGKYDDQVDALSGAIAMLTKGRKQITTSGPGVVKGRNIWRI